MSAGVLVLFAIVPASPPGVADTELLDGRHRQVRRALFEHAHARRCVGKTSPGVQTFGIESRAGLPIRRQRQDGIAVLDARSLGHPQQQRRQTLVVAEQGLRIAQKRRVHVVWGYASRDAIDIRCCHR